MSNSETFCVVPWLHRFTNEQGIHQICCAGTGQGNTLRGNNGEPLHVRQGLSDEEVLNSPVLKDVRSRMLRGEWPEACLRCHRAEDAGGASVRQGYNERFARWQEEAVASTAPDGALSQPAVRSADIRLGNVCNLTCRMCGPHASRLWADHFNQVRPAAHRIPEGPLAVMRDGNWVKSQPFQHLIAQCLPTVERINFAGGEPLIIPEMVEALESCAASGRSREIELQYNTNVTVLPERVTRLWPEFRSVRLIASVDGVGPLNDYIRRPSHWQEIDRNLRLIDENFERWNLADVVVNTTVQVYNVLEIVPLVEYLQTSFRRIFPVPQLTPLFDPSFLSISILPPNIKQAAREHLLAARDLARRRPEFETLLQTFESTLAHLERPPGSARHFMEFLYFCEKSDLEFGDSWRDACQSLAQWIPAKGA